MGEINAFEILSFKPVPNVITTWVPWQVQILNLPSHILQTVLPDQPSKAFV